MEADEELSPTNHPSGLELPLCSSENPAKRKRPEIGQAVGSPARLERIRSLIGLFTVDVSTESNGAESASRKASASAGVRREESAKKFERSLPDYGDLDYIDGGSWKSSGSELGPRPNSRLQPTLQNKKKKKRSTKKRNGGRFDNDAEETNVGKADCSIPSTSGDSASSAETTLDEKLNFDFSFDRHRDDFLVAKKAFKYYKKDREVWKYLHQREQLFSKISHGILLDRESWFSVTPEEVATHIAKCVVRKVGDLVVDAFTGAGGNAIQFAKQGAFVLAIDNDPMRLRCALRNAQIYGVADRISFFCCDFFNFARRYDGESTTTNGHAVMENGCAGQGGNESVDVVFLSPPWGGPKYLKAEVFNLEEMQPNGFRIFEVARRMSSNIAYFLPRNVDRNQLKSLRKPSESHFLEQCCMGEKVKMVTAYYGQIANVARSVAD